MTGLIEAAALLTRIPMPRSSSASVGRWSPAWFPAIGAVIGAAAGGVFVAGLTVGLSGWVAGPISVAVVLFMTGALHEDGLADTFDGLGCGRRGQAAIEVMRDPRIGTYGAAALVISVWLQVAALVSLQEASVLRVALAAHAASRGFAALALHLRTPSSPGLAAEYRANTSGAAKTLGFLVGAVIASTAMPSIWWTIPTAAVTGGLMVWAAARRFGGVTGDVIGAVQQVTLVTILVGATIQT